MFETILFEKNGPIAKVMLNRPEKLNAFTPKMQNELMEVLRLVKRDANIRSLVITGSGRAFCSGQDLGEFQGEVDYGELLRKTYNPLIHEIVSLEKPVIAAVNGVAAGAGFSLALVCDFRLVSERAVFAEAFIQVGLVPDSGHLFFLPRIVGYAKALELAVLGEKISAKEAEQLGLVTKLISPDDWEREVDRFAHRTAMLPTKAVGLIKKYMHESFHSNLTEMLENEAFAQRIAGMTEDHKEGVQAFMEKRRPDFQGK